MAAYKIALDEQPGTEMTLIHHIVRGEGAPPIVFVHGFGCAHSDLDAQVAHLSRRHQTVAVDLRGHGLSQGMGLSQGVALQTTYSNERRERQTMREGQSSRYLDMLRTRVPSARVEIIADTGHFPRLDTAERTNALIDDFLASLAVP
jgi:pimeloyl-ACP methyl ester carboxylesterase